MLLPLSMARLNEIGPAMATPARKQATESKAKQLIKNNKQYDT